MQKKSHYIILLMVVVLALAILKLPGETVSKIKLAISGLFLPLFGLSASTHQLWSDAKGNLTPKRELLRENEDLRRLVEEQQILLQQDTNVWLENQHLRALVGFQRQMRGKFKLARVMTRDPANWWRSMEIDLGSRDGVRTNYPVLTADGLVGRVQSVGETRSQIIVLGDPNLEVSARTEPGGDLGVIAAVSSSPQENGMVDLLRLSGTSSVRPGQNVLTSGEGEIFPAGILIGRIVDTRSRDDGMSLEARVKLAADLGSLREVWVRFP